MPAIAPYSLYRSVSLSRLILLIRHHPKVFLFMNKEREKQKPGGTRDSVRLPGLCPFQALDSISNAYFTVSSTVLTNDSLPS